MLVALIDGRLITKGDAGVRFLTIMAWTNPVELATGVDAVGWHYPMNKVVTSKHRWFLGTS